MRNIGTMNSGQWVNQPGKHEYNSLKVEFTEPTEKLVLTQRTNTH